MNIGIVKSEVVDLLRYLHERGVTLWQETGDLRYAGPPDALTSENLLSIQDNKQDILSFYAEQGRVDELPLTQRIPCEPIPVSFQQAWFAAMLERTKEKRQLLGRAFRLRGPLDVGALCASIDAVIQRHEALRTRFENISGAIMMRIEPRRAVGGYDLEVVSLQGSRSEVEAEARHRGRRFLSDHPSLDAESVFHARLLKLSNEDHVLLEAVDHIVADGLSNGIINREIFLSYLASTRGGAFQKVETPPLQYGDYAIWQHRTAASWDIRHGRYWEYRLEGATGVRWPVDDQVGEPASGRLATFQIHIDADLTNRLREFSRRHNTTLPRVVLAIYASFLARICDTRDILIPFLSMGRNHVRVMDMVGFFAYFLFLRIQLQESATFLDVLGVTQKELNTASEHADFGRISTQRPELLLNGGGFQWAPWAASFVERTGTTAGNVMTMREGERSSLKVSQFTVDPMDIPEGLGDVFRYPTFTFSDCPEGLRGVCGYCPDRVSPSTLERIGRSFTTLVRQYLESPTDQLADCTL